MDRRARARCRAWLLGLGALRGPLAAEKETRSTRLLSRSSGRRLAGDRHERRPLAASTLELHPLRGDAREQAPTAAAEVALCVAFRNRWAASGSAFDDHRRVILKIIINKAASVIGVPENCQGQAGDRRSTGDVEPRGTAEANEARARRRPTKRSTRGDRMDRSPLVGSAWKATRPDRRPARCSSHPCTACRPCTSSCWWRRHRRRG